MPCLELSCTDYVDPAWEPIALIILSLIYGFTMHAVWKNRGLNGVIIATCLMVPVLTHFWHILYSEGTLNYWFPNDGGANFLDIFNVQSSDLVVIDGITENGEGLGLSGALFNTYEFTVAASMLILYGIAAIYLRSFIVLNVGIWLFYFYGFVDFYHRQDSSIVDFYALDVSAFLIGLLILIWWAVSPDSIDDWFDLGISLPSDTSSEGSR